MRHNTTVNRYLCADSAPTSGIHIVKSTPLQCGNQVCDVCGQFH